MTMSTRRRAPTILHIAFQPRTIPQIRSSRLSFSLCTHRSAQAIEARRTPSRKRSTCLTTMPKRRRPRGVSVPSALRSRFSTFSTSAASSSTGIKQLPCSRALRVPTTTSPGATRSQDAFYGREEPFGPASCTQSSWNTSARKKPLAIICTHITAANVAVSARMITGFDFPHHLRSDRLRGGGPMASPPYRSVLRRKRIHGRNAASAQGARRPHTHYRAYPRDRLFALPTIATK